MIRLRRGAETIADLESAIADALDQLQDDAALGRVTIAADLASGSNEVAHKLGRAAVGWLVVDVDAAADFYREAATDEATHLAINASAACAVTLEVW